MKRPMKFFSILMCLALVLTLSFGMVSCGTADISSYLGDGTDSAVAVVTGVSVVEGKIVVSYSDGSIKTVGSAVTNVTNNEITVNASPETSAELAASRALLSTVGVQCKFTKTETYITGGFPFGTTQQRDVDYYTFGSGVIYQLDKAAGDAYIITNYHVVYDASSKTSDGISREIGVYMMGDTTTMAATFVGGSPNYDIAVLRVSGNPYLSTSVAEAAEVNYDDPHVGQASIVVGNPKASGISVTQGVVSVDSENITMSAIVGSGNVTFRVMRVDAAINSGNSGGGLYDAEGKLIGIVNAKVVSENVDDIGYAIPSGVAAAIAQNIIDYCADGSCKNVRRVKLGIDLDATDSGMVYDTATGLVHIEETVLVKDDVKAGTPAAQMGVQKGDVLVSIRVGDRAEKSISRQFHVVDEMLNARVGNTVTLTVLRGGTELELTITVAESFLVDY